YVVQNATGWAAVNGGNVFSSTTSNSISGNASGNTAPPSLTPAPAPAPTPTPPPSPTYVARNIVSDFGATCNGSTDDSAAFAAFNAWATTQALQVQLTIPFGATCTFLTNTGSNWTNGIKNLLVIGYGATITNKGSSTVIFNFGTGGVCHRGLTD